MARIEIADYDAQRHVNHMWSVDDRQGERHRKDPGLIPYKVCLVTVAGFTFEFHSLAQVEAALAYYRRPVQPSSRLSGPELGCSHTSSQRWFDKLPQFLLERARRPKVVVALEKALEKYGKHPSARTGKKEG